MLIGNIGKEPEVKKTASGTSVANISVATTEKFTSNGEKQEKTEWHTVIFWGKLADIVGQYCQKGTKIYCEGRIETRQWEKDGAKHYKTEIIASELKILEGWKGGNKPAPMTANKAEFQDESNLPF
jgi:single-strand DNA-binding protein